MNIVEKGCWYGVLEAGSKSSPVVRDSVLDTAKKDTIYLYNFNRNLFVEYRREIVEPKLREFNADESEILEAITEAFLEARKSFTPRRLYKPAPKKRTRKAAEDEVPEFNDDDDLDKINLDDDDSPLIDDIDDTDDIDVIDDIDDIDIVDEPEIHVD